MSDSEDPVDVADEGDDLFGDGAEDSDNERPLSDHELDEDEEHEQRHRDRDDDEERDQEVKSKVIMTQKMYRHRIPKPKDGTLRILKVPDFLKLIPEEYKADSYEPDAWDLEEDKKKYPARVIRFRRDEETGKIESNAAVYRWSDGSVTIAVGDQHFEIDVKRLAPPEKQYDEKKDANYYAAAAHLSSNSLLTVGHITEEFKVRPNAALEEAAIDRLMTKMEAVNKKKSDADLIVQLMEDPELRRKQAELAEKERERARRKRENAAARMDGSSGGGGGRYGGGRGGGLSISGLESGGGRRAKGGAGGAKPRQKRRRPEYDSDDDLPQGARRQDNYDMGDEFIAPSDEEISEEADEDDDEEELLDDDEDEEDERPRRTKRQKTAESTADEDADGEADDDAPAAHAEQSSRRGRRHIVDDDDE